VTSATLDHTYIPVLQFGGEAFSILELGRADDIDLAVSEEIIMETLAVLCRKFACRISVWMGARDNSGQRLDSSASTEAQRDHGRPRRQ